MGNCSSSKLNHSDIYSNPSDQHGDDKKNNGSNGIEHNKDQNSKSDLLAASKKENDDKTNNKIHSVISVSQTNHKMSQDVAKNLRYGDNAGSRISNKTKYDGNYFILFDNLDINKYFEITKNLGSGNFGIVRVGKVRFKLNNRKNQQMSYSQ